jgi:hypothetical protein
VGSWLIPLVIGVLVAGAVFVVAASRPSQTAKRALEESGIPDVSLSEAGDKQFASTSANSGGWGKTAIIAGAIGAVAVAVFFLYDALGFGAPTCASKATQETVLRIVKQQTAPLVLSLAAASAPLTAIRTTDKNLAGALSCAASFEKDPSLSIYYKVEQTSDGKLYVAVTRFVSNGYQLFP